MKYRKLYYTYTYLYIHILADFLIKTESRCPFDFLVNRFLVNKSTHFYIPKCQLGCPMAFILPNHLIQIIGYLNIIYDLYFIVYL